MTKEEVISNLQCILDLFQFDPMTGETIDKSCMNELNRLHCTALEEAIRLLKSAVKEETSLYYQGKPLFQTESTIVSAARSEKSYPQYLIEELHDTAESTGIHLNYQESRRLFEIHESEQPVPYRNLILESVGVPTQFMNKYEQKECFATMQAEMEVQKSVVRNWISEKIRNGELYAKTE